MLVPLGRCLSPLPPRVFGLKLYWNASRTLLPRARLVRETMNRMMATSRMIIVVRTTMTTPMKLASFGSWSMGRGAITAQEGRRKRAKAN